MTGVQTCALPILLGGGDDYELLFAAPAARRAAIEKLGGAVALTRVGVIREASAGFTILDAAGVAMPLPRGFDHFAA